MMYLFLTTGDPYGIVIDEAISFNMPVICSDQVGKFKIELFMKLMEKFSIVDQKKSLVNSIMAYYKILKF